MTLTPQKFCIRFAIVIFWLTVFSLFLFMSRLPWPFREKKSIRIFTFPLLVDAQRLSEFEQRTGIKLYVHYYENNDELLAKFFNGHQNYDIVFPSDYATNLLIKKGLLKKIDRTRLTFFDHIHKKLLGHYFDPYNAYSIPYLWEVYGIGFDKRYFGSKKPEPTWSILFDERIGPSRVGMLNNAREVVAIAAVYLFGRVGKLDAHHLDRIKELLLAQKKRVEVYTDLRADYLLASKTCAAVACPADDVWLHDDPNFEFLIPREGSFVSIDSICIPASCKRQDVVYQFINYLYEPKVMAHHVDKYAFFPARKGIPVKRQGQTIMARVLREFCSFHFFRSMVPTQELINLWVTLKAQ